jgi:hypothetical protein
MRPAREPRDWAVSLCYSVPVDGEQLTVLVGAPRLSGDAELPAEELASLLTALPPATRSAVRLAPCGPIDLLSVTQDTAEILGAELEVWTGLPLVVGSETEPLMRPVLIGADAEPTWAPFVEAVACRRTAPTARTVPPRRGCSAGGRPSPMTPKRLRGRTATMSDGKYTADPAKKADAAVEAMKDGWRTPGSFGGRK